jgi:Type I restriction-modification system methyltransferase subunit
VSTQLTFDAVPPSPVHLIEQPQPEVNLRSLPEIKKDFHNTIKKLSYSRHTWQVWEDFCELAAMSLANSVMFSEARETRYMDTIAKYEPEEVQLFPRLLGMVTEALEIEFQDFLGEMFMELEMGNKWKGQFFTPYSVSSMMAQMTLTSSAFDEKDIVEFNEPAAGAGAMCIALCEHVRDNLDISFHDRLRIVAQDVDRTAAHMCYIQLSLIGAQARVVWGNTLKVEVRDVYVTPFAVMKGWLN